MTELCPCGSGEEFSRCCGPFLARETLAPSAEALMRSRYTAYVRGDMGYLERTLLPRLRGAFDVRDTKAWNADVVWTGLRILATQGGQAGDKEGVVEFIASFRRGDTPHDHHERSRFRKKGQEWFYVDGLMGAAAPAAEASATPAVSTGPKVGRNDPCPCGSGKKFKRCCG